MDPLSEKTFWDEYWQSETSRDVHQHVFQEIFRKYLPQAKSYFEVGCAPGSTMVYFAEQFGYRVSGLDYSSIDQVESTLRRHVIEAQDLVAEDFLTFESTKQYGVVASFGFVEHFRDDSEVIRRHMQLVEPDGYLVIEVPNIRYGNYLLYRLLKPELLAIHNLAVMNRHRLERPIRASPDFDVLFSGYYKSCFLYFNPDNAEIADHPWRRRLLRGMRLILDVCRLGNIPNRFFSPYLFVIAKRKPRSAAGV